MSFWVNENVSNSNHAYALANTLAHTLKEKEGKLDNESKIKSEAKPWNLYVQRILYALMQTPKCHRTVITIMITIKKSQLCQWYCIEESVEYRVYEHTYILKYVCKSYSRSICCVCNSHSHIHVCALPYIWFDLVLDRFSSDELHWIFCIFHFIPFHSFFVLSFFLFINYYSLWLLLFYSFFPILARLFHLLLRISIISPTFVVWVVCRNIVW